MGKLRPREGKWLTQRAIVRAEKGPESQTPTSPPTPHHHQFSPQGRQTALLTTVLVTVFTAEVDLASLIPETGLLSSGLEQLRRLEFLKSVVEL